LTRTLSRSRRPNRPPTGLRGLRGLSTVGAAGGVQEMGTQGGDQPAAVDGELNEDQDQARSRQVSAEIARQRSSLSVDRAASCAIANISKPDRTK
jgi:hypothetical protein